MPVKITDTAVVSAQRSGMYGNVRLKLTRMVRLSAPVTHARANYRFEQWLFHVVDGKLVHVESHAVAQAPDRRRGKRGPRSPGRVVYSQAVNCAICGGTMTVDHYDPKTRRVATTPCEWRQDPSRGGPCDIPQTTERS